MDIIDIKILDCLRENSRMTASAISSCINLSVSAVTERIRRLEECGIIKQYTLLLDEVLIGEETRAYLEVSLNGSDYSDIFCAQIHAMESILRCDYLSAEFDYLLLAQTPDVESLSRLHTEIKAIPGVRTVRLRLILKTEKNCTTALPKDI